MENKRADRPCTDAPEAVRIPWLIMADVSLSMKINEAELCRVVGELRQGILQHEGICERVDMGLMTFAEEIRMAQPFVPAERFSLPEKLEFCGMSPMYTALRRALDAVKEHAEACRMQGKSAGRPVIWLLTDDSATDVDDGICEEIVRLQQERELAVIVVNMDKSGLGRGLLALHPERFVWKPSDEDFVQMVSRMYRTPAYPPDWEE